MMQLAIHQPEFARPVTAVEKLKTARRTHLAELGTLLASPQHRAFNGELLQQPRQKP
jgi:type I restriction enzyme, S subunit